VAYAASYLRWYAEEAVRIHGRYTRQQAGRGRVLVGHQPVGPALLVTPWNFPLAMGARKVAPAIAAGCTCVVKPAEQTPLSMLAFGQVLMDAGLPAGSVNVITGSDAEALTDHLFHDPRLRKISFTGSTEVGRVLLRKATHQLLRTSMELGGNAPFIVFADADLERAVEQAVLAKMRNGGEACTAANRFLVHTDVAERFGDGLASAMAALRLGPGTARDSDVGPLIDGAHRERVRRLTADATVHGARVVTGGETCEGPGYFYRPTVLADVPRSAEILREEIFGPVASITTFRDEGEALSLANGSLHGLAGYVFTDRFDRALRVAERLETGMVGINEGVISTADAPFGGVKHSGMGVEGGPEGLMEYLTTRYMAFDADGREARSLS
jgi:succinate-semialdehyde dehydrogenase / glutarate-semialdehyde dehydrogenase